MGTKVKRAVQRRKPLDPLLKGIMADLHRRRATRAALARRNLKKFDRGRPKPPPTIFDIIRRAYPQEVREIFDNARKTRAWMERSVQAFARERYRPERIFPPPPPPTAISLDSADAIFPTSGDCVGDVQKRNLALYDDITGRGGPYGLVAVATRFAKPCDLYFNFLPSYNGYAVVVIKGYVRGLYVIRSLPAPSGVNNNALFRFTVEGEASTIDQGKLVQASTSIVVHDLRNANEVVGETTRVELNPIVIQVKQDAPVKIRVSAYLLADAFSNYSRVYADYCSNADYGVLLDPVLVLPTLQP